VSYHRSADVAVREASVQIERKNTNKITACLAEYCIRVGDDFHVQRWLSCHVFRRLFTISRKPSSLSARCFASPVESRLRGHHLCRAGAVAVTFDPKVLHSAYSNVDAGEAAVSSGR